MVRYLATVLTLLLASFHVSAAPTQEASPPDDQGLRNFGVQDGREGVSTQLDGGISWATLGIGNPKFSTHGVTAQGMEAEIAVDKAQGIVIVDHLSNDVTASEGAHITGLIRQFMKEASLQKLNYLAINNIVEKNTIPYLNHLQIDTYTGKGSKLYTKLTTSSPLGRIGNSLGTIQGIYIADVRGAASGVQQSGGPAMIFFYSGVQVPSALLSKANAGAAPGAPGGQYRGVPAAGGNAALEADAMRQDRQRQRAADAALGKEDKKNKKNKKDCNLMKREASALGTPPGTVQPAC